MNDPEPFESSKLLRLQRWVDFVKSDEWKDYKTLLLERKAYLEKQVLIYVRCKKHEEAEKTLARADELLSVIKTAEGQITKEQDNGNE